MLKALSSAVSAALKGSSITWLKGALAAACLAGGAWLGVTWQRGADAVAEVAELRTAREHDRQTIEELTRLSRDMQQHAIDTTLAYDRARERLDAIATTLEVSLERDRNFSASQRDALAALLADRPDLRALRLGADVLQHWNRSNQGADAAEPPIPTAPATDIASEPENAVPAVSAGDARHGGASARQSRRRGDDRAAMPRASQRAADHDGPVAGDRLELVLHGDRHRGF